MCKNRFEWVILSMICSRFFFDWIWKTFVWTRHFENHTAKFWTISTPWFDWKMNKKSFHIERKRIGTSSIQRITLYGPKFCDFCNNLIRSMGFCAKDHQDADKGSKMCYIERALGDKTSKSWPLNIFQFERTGDVAHRHALCIRFVYVFCVRPKEPKITIEIVRFLIGFNSQRC